jgi:hypothetical protein
MAIGRHHADRAALIRREGLPAAVANARGWGRVTAPTSVARDLVRATRGDVPAYRIERKPLGREGGAFEEIQHSALA